MTFSEIFKEEGLYIAESFAKGVCFEISGHRKELVLVEFKSVNDLSPKKSLFTVYQQLFEKEYKRVNNINQLFSK